MNKLKGPQIFVLLIFLVGFGAVVTSAVKAIQASMARASEDRVTLNLCREWVPKILADAKANAPEKGTYEATLPVNDSWGQPLTSILVVEELANFARVHSDGRDMVAVSGDDIAYSKKDVHVRKSILSGIVAGSHAAGKGVTSGVIEGLGEAKDASLQRAKDGAKKIKTSLMTRFKKKESKK